MPNLASIFDIPDNLSRHSFDAINLLESNYNYIEI